MPVYSTGIGGSTFTGSASTLLINNNINGILPIGITNHTDAFTTGGLIFSGSNVTFNTYVDGASQYLLVTAGIGGIAASAGTEIVTDGTMIFSNDNGISFGFSDYTITASHNAFSATSQLTNYLAPKTHIHGSVSLDMINLSGATASASDGLTLSLTGLPAQSQMPSVISINGASGSLTFNEGSFVNISQNLRSFTFNVTNTSAFTTNAFPSVNTTKFAGTGTTINIITGSDLKVTLDSHGIDFGIPQWLTSGGGGGGAVLQGSGTYTQNSGTIQFVNSNDITFGLTNGQMTASFSQSTFDDSALFPSSDTTKFAGTGTTVDVTDGTELKVVVNSDGVNFSVPPYITTFDSQTIQPVAVSASNGSYSFSTLNFGTDNGITFYTNENGIQASYTVPIVPSIPIFSNSNNVTFGFDGITITASASYTNPGATVFSNSHNITFGLSGSTITASASYSQSTHEHSTLTFDYAATHHTHSDLYIALGNSTAYQTSILSNTFQTTGAYLTTAAESSHVHIQYQSTGDYLTTAMLSDAGSLFAGTGSTFNTVTGKDVLITYGSGGFNISMPDYITTYAVGGGEIDVSAGSASASLASVIFSNSNGVTFGLNGSTITASVKTDYQSSGNYLTTAMQSQMTSAFQYTSATSAITGNAFNASQSSLFQLTSDNSLSLGTSYSTHTHNYQSTGAYLTTAALSNHTHSNLYIGLANSTAYQTSVLSGTFQTTGAYLTTGALSNHIHGSISTYTVTGSQLLHSSISNGLTLSVPRWIITTPTQSLDTQFVGLSSTGITGGSMTANSSGLLINIPESFGSIHFIDGSGVTFNITTATDNNTTVGASAAAGGGDFSNSTDYLQTTYTNHTHSQYVNVSVTSAYQLISNSVLSLGTGYSTHTHNYQPAGNYLTTAMASDYSSRFAGTGSTLTTTSGSQLRMTYNSLGINLAVPAWLTAGGGVQTLDTQFVGLLTTGASGALVTANSSQLIISVPSNAGNLYFGDSNNVSFTINTDGSSTTVIASAAGGGGGGGGDWVISTRTGTDVLISTGAATNVLYQPRFITSQTRETQFAGILSTGLTGGSWTINSSQLSLNIPSNAGSLGFADSNGISFGIVSTASNSSTVVTASYNLIWSLEANGGSVAGNASSAVSLLKLIAGAGVTLSGGSNGITILA